MYSVHNLKFMIIKEVEYQTEDSSYTASFFTCPGVPSPPPDRAASPVTAHSARALYASPGSQSVAHTPLVTRASPPWQHAQVRGTTLHCR